MVTVVAVDDPFQPFSNSIDRFMQTLTELRLDAVERRPHPLNHGLAADNEMAFGVRRTVVREPKKRERLRFSLSTLLSIYLREPTELDQSRLLRMKLQLEVRQTFPKLSQEPLCVLTMLEADHQIVSVADHD
jgi:hypothetical protein